MLARELKLKSSAFPDGGIIPTKFTCDGKNISPQLIWSDVPEEARSFALLMEDPDAKARTWRHWALCNIPKDVRQISEDKVPNEANFFRNDFGKNQYGGPFNCRGMHRYYFRLFALDVDKIKNLEELDAHTIEKAELMGVYPEYNI